MCGPCRPSPCEEGGSKSTFGDCKVRQRDSNFKEMVGCAARCRMVRRKHQAEFNRKTRSDQKKQKEKAVETEGEDLKHLATFAKTFKVGEVVAVAVHVDEQLDFSNTDFYLAVVEDIPVKLNKDNANRFKSRGVLEAGRWIFTCRWLELVREDEDTGARHYKIEKGDLVQHDVGVVLRMPDKDDPENQFFEVGSMDAPREVGSTFELAADSVQYILQCIAKDAATE